MTTICLVRHGQTDWNALGKLQGQTDIPLNELGKIQARQCGEFLSEEDWDVIISSPLKRARETAEIISNYIEVPVIEKIAFIEKNFGVAEGMTAAERKAAFTDKLYPGQENQDSLRNRLMNGLQEIQKEYPDKKVILVAHGAVIHFILRLMSNESIVSKEMRLFNACLSTIRFDADSWIIDDFNQVNHLS
ncbi:histidine phosphatase family protein [Peribacillus sp. SIMBA_075]|uniref:histidine phosphatase family protein n=1 Tax=Peribacillus TaxID=2675229 RepID=UPI00298E0D2A|nr:histidine phosphatase family protein [Peribacillus simplex]MDW7616858.1 histidine phosphatase family protein [Peribacillus simplex]